MSEKTRQLMRETHGLVDALVCYIKCSLEGNTAEDKVGPMGMPMGAPFCWGCCCQ